MWNPNVLTVDYLVALRKRFLAKVDKHSSPYGCWLWTGATSSGYGKIMVGYKMCQAHVVSWLLHVRPPKQWVLHNCPGGDNPLCVNPEHLWEGNVRDNSDDKIDKRRHVYGSGHPRAVVDESSVHRIRELYATGKYTQTALAKQFCVSCRVVFAVIHNLTWKHMPPCEKLIARPKWKRAVGDCNGARLYPERLKRGESCHTARLTATKIQQIRKLYSIGINGVALAKHYGVTSGAVYAILRGRSWKHVP